MNECCISIALYCVLFIYRFVFAVEQVFSVDFKAAAVFLE